MVVLGRLLQILAMILLPLSMLAEMTQIQGRSLLGRPFGVSDMVIMLVFGFALFYVGRMIEGYSRRGSR